MDSKLIFLMIVFGIFVVISLIILIKESIATKKKREYIYTPKDVTVEQKKFIKSFGVVIKDVRKEKNKEDVYIISFKDLEGYGKYNETRAMTKTEYENLIGEENNTISGEVLEIKFSANKITDKNCEMNLYVKQFLCLGDEEIEENEINLLLDESLKIFRDYNSGIEVDSPKKRKILGYNCIFYLVNVVGDFNA